MPPSKYLGHSTWRIFSQTASRSRRSVSQTDSSNVLTGARRSSPGIAEFRYPWALWAERELELACDEEMLPVRGARSSVRPPWAGSSRSSRVARDIVSDCDQTVKPLLWNTDHRRDQ